MPGPVNNTGRATKRWKLLIGDSEYQGHTSKVEYNDNAAGTSWRGGDDNTIPDVTDGDPTIALTMAMDSENELSLYRVLFDAPKGTPMTFVWYPHYDGDFALSVDFKSLRPPVNTDRAGGMPEATVTLPCSEAVPYTDDDEG